VNGRALKSEEALMALLEQPTRRRFSPLGALEALATPHGLDRYLELVHPMLTVRELRAEVTEVRHTTADSVTLTLRPTRRWRGFRAGQYVQVAVEIDGVRRTRCYSPSSSQHRADGRIELTVKAHADGLVSRHLVERARPGLVVGLAPAEGAFTLPETRPDRVLLISGGSGITPVLSMLRTLVDERHRGEIVFLHYAPSADDVALREELTALAAVPTVRVVLAHTRTDDGELSGHFTPEHLAAVAPDPAGTETFVCGPPALLAAVREHWSALGLADRLHTEEFVATTVAAPDADATGTLTFGRSGVSADNDGTSVLEQAEAAGLTPEHGCRMGICFSCTAVKTSGCTRNLLTGDLHTEPDSEIQLCISAPVGDVAIDL
jgi:stearoyl-CoA 9-desaturase NADPH oxidoreductase